MSLVDLPRPASIGLDAMQAVLVLRPLGVAALPELQEGVGETAVGAAGGTAGRW